MERKSRNKLVGIVAAVLALSVGVVGVALANGADKDGKDGKDGKDHAAHRAEMLTKYDANKDGQLDDTERAKMRDDMVTERFNAMDTDKNGSLSLAEVKAGFAKMGPRGGGRGHHGHHGHHGDKDGKDGGKDADKDGK